VSRRRPYGDRQPVVHYPIRCPYGHLLATARRRLEDDKWWLDGPPVERSSTTGPGGIRWRFTCPRCREAGHPRVNVEHRQDRIDATLAAKVSSRRSAMPYDARQ